MKTTEYFRNLAGFALPSPTRTSASGSRPKTFLLRGLTTLVTALGLAFAGLNSVYAVDFCVNPGFENSTTVPPKSSP